jgi:CopG family nickel-responsive transcriptional regulator
MTKNKGEETSSMNRLERLSFSIEKGLSKRFAAAVKSAGCDNRSEFLRDLIRQRLVGEEWRGNREVVGTVTLIYDHHQRNLTAKLTELQHERHRLILATTHVHLDHDTCVEAVVVQGRAKEIQALTDALRRQKGVLHVVLAVGAAAKRLK